MWGRVLALIIVIVFSREMNVTNAFLGGFQPILVDLTHTFNDKIYFWKNDAPMQIVPKVNAEQPGGYWETTEGLIAGTTHSGTHIDAPCFRARGRWCISDIPLRNLVGRQAVVIDISAEVGDNPNVNLQPSHLMDWETKHGRIPDGSVLLICTGWSRFFPDMEKYLGTKIHDHRELLKFPSIHKDAAKWIAENRNIIGIGIDSMGLDTPSQMSYFPVHSTLLSLNIYALINLNNVCWLPPTGARVTALPIKLEHAGASPMNIFAEVP